MVELQQLKHNFYHFYDDTDASASFPVISMVEHSDFRHTWHQRLVDIKHVLPSSLWFGNKVLAKQIRFYGVVEKLYPSRGGYKNRDMKYHVKKQTEANTLR